MGVKFNNLEFLKWLSHVLDTEFYLNVGRRKLLLHHLFQDLHRFNARLIQSHTLQNNANKTTLPPAIHNV